MRRTLKVSTNLVLAVGLIASALVAAAQARQVRDARVISAKAGGVNLVTGRAEFRRAGEKVWMSLFTKDDLAAGDVVRTAAAGRVELLLNPGTYWRADGSTEFELTSDKLDDLVLRLDRGSAVIEATGFGDYDSLGLVVVTPQTRVRVVRAGVYRFKVLPTGETVLAVEKGRAFVGAGDGLKVKGGKLVRVAGDGAAPEVAKFDKKARDEFDLWSRERGRELARANERLAARQNRTMLAGLDFDRYFSTAYPSGGLWLYNSETSCYTFLSFHPGWRSPYGFGYRSWLSVPPGLLCSNCPSGNGNFGGGLVHQTPNNTGGGNQPGGNNGGSRPGGGMPSSPPMSPPMAPPPSRDADVGRPFQGPRERMVEPGRDQL
ncbi:MAG TPA: hypothetical protein VEY09_19730 [Pyrinomonadaceae bacterium]|nr:hypothetical protein [Pyrinomonadaceae bacterium]